jgi:hypothetical protein
VPRPHSPEPDRNPSFYDLRVYSPTSKDVKPKWGEQRWAGEWPNESPTVLMSRVPDEFEVARLAAEERMKFMELDALRMKLEVASSECSKHSKYGK